jgi:transposase-like protein
MRVVEFERWRAKVSKLTPHQREVLGKQLQAGDPTGGFERTLTEGLGPITSCPHCKHAEIRPWGRSHGLARYRCRGCKRTFNRLTGTPLARLRHKEQWLTYTQALVDGVGVRKAALRCGVNKSTAFLWRHRFLASPSMMKAQQGRGIVEADETYFLESFKGTGGLPRKPRKRGGKAHKRGTSAEQIPVLITRDREGRTADYILPAADKKHIGDILKPLMAEDAILCTDGGGHGVFAAVAKEHGLTHRPVNVHAGIRVRAKVYHVQNVNAYTSRLKEWMHRFHGVATKHLHSYLGWRRMLERSGNDLDPKLCLVQCAGFSNAQQLTQT